MGDCRFRILVLPRHLSAHGHAAVAACDLADDDHADGMHAGALLEVDRDRVVEEHGTLVRWHAADRRSFLRPLQLAHGLEPPTCDRETEPPGARCALPARHGGECAP